MNNSGKEVVPWVKAGILVLLMAVLGILVWRALPPEWLAPARLESFLSKSGVLAPLAFILIRAVGIVLTFVPNAPLDIAGGVIFGPFWGTVYSLLGSEAGAIACFLLARLLGREAVARLLHRDIAFSDRIARRHLAYVVLFARLEPIFSFALVSYGAGLTRMSLTSFALSTLAGMTPGTILLNYYGKSLFTGNIQLQIGMGLILVGMLFVVPIWIRRKNPWGLYEKLKRKERSNGEK